MEIFYHLAYALSTKNGDGSILNWGLARFSERKKVPVPLFFKIEPSPF
jgi:hypothetical protein